VFQKDRQSADLFDGVITKVHPRLVPRHPRQRGILFNLFQD